MNILCLGHGFTSSTLKSLHPEHQVRFLSRRPTESDESFKNSGEPGGAPFVPMLILDSVPPVYSDGRMIGPLYRSEVDHFPDAIYVHLSSTSVYSHSNATEPGESTLADGFVDERSRPIPDDDRGRARLELEESVLLARSDAVILRCGGIYGPGRSLPLSLVRGGGAHIPDRNRYVSRIHVYDLCRLIIAAAQRLISTKGSGREVPSLFPGYRRRNLLCAVDPNPSSTIETLQFIRSEWGCSVPSVPDGPTQGRKVKSLYASGLIGEFQFPSFREGFRQSMKTAG